MDIITKSHIDQAHADSQYFPEAESADGRFRWHFGSELYVQVVALGRAIYLPAYTADGRSTSPDWPASPELPPAVIADARAFVEAVADLRNQRRQGEIRAEAEAYEQERNTPRAVPQYGSDGAPNPYYVTCPTCNAPQGHYCRGESLPEGASGRPGDNVTYIEGVGFVPHSARLRAVGR